MPRMETAVLFFLPTFYDGIGSSTLMNKRESGRLAHLMKPASPDVNYGASVGSLDRQHQHRK